MSLLLRCRGLWEKRLHKTLRIEWLQVLDALAHSHKLDGHPQLIHHADLHTA